MEIQQLMIPHVHQFGMRLTILGVISLVFVVSGCGASVPHSDKPRSAVQVTVTRNGQLLPGAELNLVNDATGEGGGGVLNAESTVELEHVAHGTYQVVVLPPPADPLPPTEGSPSAAAPNILKIPASYRSAKTTPFHLTIPSETSEYTFDIPE